MIHMIQELFGQTLRVSLDRGQGRLAAVWPEYFRQLMAEQPWQGRTLFPFPAVGMHSLED